MVKREDSEQITFINRVRHLYPWLSDCVMAIPNGGFRHPKLAALLKLAGVLKGAPDILVAVVRPVPRSSKMIYRWGARPGLFIEMKRKKGGKVSDDQHRVHSALRRQGYEVVVANGADQAWSIFEEYVHSDEQQARREKLVWLELTKLEQANG
jgi:hypothetical protein